MSKKGEPRLKLCSQTNTLTNGQLRVVSLLAKGMTNREIGEALIISEYTVRTYMNQIISKLGVTNRTGVVVRAQQLGLIETDGLSQIAQTIRFLLTIKPDAVDELINAGWLKIEKEQECPKITTPGVVCECLPTCLSA